MSSRILSAILTILLVVSITGTAYLGYIKVTQNPCSTPKTWSIGAIDPRFALSTSTVKLYTEGAATTWNTAYPENQLLRYVEKGGDITVTFVYDERQRTTIQNEKLKQTISAEKNSLDDLKSTLESLKEEYAALGKTVNTKTKAYTTHLASHNNEVSYWNDQGGAPRDKYQELQRDEAVLETERTSLNADIERYNQLAERIKTYGENHNQVVDTINQKIQTLNQTVIRDFQEGTYDPATKDITIYEFDTATSLKRVLTHEIGHAIGLKHVEDKTAIMYSVNQGDNLTLTQADLDELSRVCREKTSEDILTALKTTRDGISRLLVSSWRDTAAQSK